MFVFLCVGGLLIYNGNFWTGVFPFMIGFLMFKGFKQPEATPRRVWLLTFLGQKTDTIVDTLTLVLDWIPVPLVGYVEFNMMQVDRDFPVKKPIKCTNGYVNGSLSVSFKPDEDDDQPYVSDWRSGAEKLHDFDNAGGTTEIKLIENQLDDILTVWVQHFARNQTTEWMEEYGLELGNLLLPCIMGRMDIDELRQHIPTPFSDTSIMDSIDELRNTDIDDTRELGIDIVKFQINLKASDAVIDARNNQGVEEANRRSELHNARTMNQKIAERTRLFREGVKDENGLVIIPPDALDKQPTMAEINRILILEDIEEREKATAVVNPGGFTVANVNTPTGGRP